MGDTTNKKREVGLKKKENMTSKKRDINNNSPKILIQIIIITS